LPLVLAASCAVAIRMEAKPPSFLRGDADASGSLDLSDAIRTLNFLFLGFDAPPCLGSADSDDNGRLELTDAVRVLAYLFLGGLPPAAPFPDCGLDPTPDPLSCDRFPPCETFESEEFRTVAASFGILDTVAGAGRTGADTNDWQPAFEGGLAVDAELSTPHNTLADDAGNLYIADKDAHAVRKVTPDGRIVTVAGTNAAGDDGDAPGPGTERRLSEPNGLWVRGDGTVYILDLGNSKVRRLSPAGELTLLFVVPNLRTGRGLWVADDESLAYVASRNLLLRWTPETGVETYASGFVQLGNLAVDAKGNVIVTDRNANRVYLVNLDREVSPIAGNGGFSGGGHGRLALETGLQEVRGVWIHETSGYFLATQAGSQIWYVDTLGTIYLFLDGAPDNAHSGDGELYNSPGKKVSQIRSVTMDRAGNLLVTEHDFGFVRIVRRLPPS
jgi:sugar lactone lactonase YvrE